MKKFILILIVLTIIGCGSPMDRLDIVNGTEYIVTAKKINRRGAGYAYSLLKVGESTWYDYLYKDTTDFNIGDTIIITVRKVDN